MLNNIFFKTVNDSKILLALFIYLIFVLLLCSHMSPLYYSNEWADVNVYFNIGKAIINGKVLYTDVFDHKGPIIFFIYGFGYLLSPTSFNGMFLIQLSSWFIMSCSIYYLSKLYLNQITSIIIAMILPVFLVKIMKAGGSAEEFILTAECISLYYFVKYFKNKQPGIHTPYIMLIHGILFAFTFYIKVNLALFWFFPIAGIFINLFLEKKHKNIILNFLYFIIGFIIITIPIISYMIVNNSLTESYNIYIELNRKYASIQGIPETVRLLSYRILYLYIEPFSLYLMPSIAIIYFPFKCIDNIIGKIVFVLMALLLYVIIFISPVFQMYYPIPALAYSILGVLSIFIILKKYITVSNYNYLLILFLGMVIGYVAISQKDELNETKIASILVKNPGLLTQKLHNEIIKEKNPTLLNLSFGLGNSLFTTCNIIPSVRYFFTPNLTYNSYPDLRDEQTKYVTQKATDFIIIEKPIFKFSDQVLTKKREINSYDYFHSLSVFKNNYTLILTDTIINTIDERSFQIYELYKVKK